MKNYEFHKKTNFFLLQTWVPYNAQGSQLGTMSKMKKNKTQSPQTKSYSEIERFSNFSTVLPTYLA